jgi:hypothetical protein
MVSLMWIALVLWIPLFRPVFDGVMEEGSDRLIAWSVSFLFCSSSFSLLHALSLAGNLVSKTIAWGTG